MRNRVCEAAEAGLRLMMLLVLMMRMQTNQIFFTSSSAGPTVESFPNNHLHVEISAPKNNSCDLSPCQRPANLFLVSRKRPAEAERKKLVMLHESLACTQVLDPPSLGIADRLLTLLWPHKLKV